MNSLDTAESTFILSLISFWPAKQVSSKKIMLLHRNESTYSYWAHCLSWRVCVWNGVGPAAAWVWSQALSGCYVVKVGHELWGHDRVHKREEPRERPIIIITAHLKSSVLQDTERVNGLSVYCKHIQNLFLCRYHIMARLYVCMCAVSMHITFASWVPSMGSSSRLLYTLIPFASLSSKACACKCFCAWGRQWVCLRVWLQGIYKARNGLNKETL